MNKKQADFKVSGNEAGARIDLYLSKHFQDFSRSYISKLIEQGKVTVNHKNTVKSHIVREGDLVTVKDTKAMPLDLKPQNLGLKVVYEDNWMMVVSKPPGMVCHPGPGHSESTMVNALLYYCNRLSGLNESQRPGLVHRLDKDTSGLLIIAKDNRTHELLSELFKKRVVKKNYLALVTGGFSEKKGKIMLPIARSVRDRKKMGISVDRGRQAITVFRVIQSFGEKCSLLDVRLETGRTHQIRVHLSYIGHPVVGDAQYGNRESLRIAGRIGLKRHFLHAQKMEFVHPVTGKTLKIEDRLPEDIQAALDKLSGLNGNEK